MDAFFREQQIRYLTTMADISAIIQVGGNITAALSGGQGSNGDSVRKILKELQALLLPASSFEEEERGERMRKLLESEVSKGPLTVRPVGVSRKPKKKTAKRG